MPRDTMTNDYRDRLARICAMEITGLAAVTREFVTELSETGNALLRDGDAFDVQSHSRRLRLFAGSRARKQWRTWRQLGRLQRTYEWTRNPLDATIDRLITDGVAVEDYTLIFHSIGDLWTVGRPAPTTQYREHAYHGEE